MKKYLWIAVFFMTNLCFAQPDADLPKSSTDNNLMLQLVDSKLANVNNKLTAVEQSNKDDIADLKARVDEKLADKFKQLDDRAGTIDWWLSILGIVLAVLGILMPFGAFWLNRKIDKNIKDSRTITKQAVEQIENKLKEADKLLTEMTVFHRNAERSVSEIEDLANKANLGNLTPEDSQKLKNDSNELKNIPENQLTANDWFIRGLNAQNNKEYYEAITYYNAAIKLTPPKELTASIYNNRGVAKYELGNYRAALSDYDKTIELNPKSAEAYNNRGNANAKSDEYDVAISDYNQAIKLNPRYAKAYNHRGIVESKLGDHHAALSDYNQAIELNPKDSGVYFNKACAYALMKNKTEALNWLDKSLQLDYSVENVLKNKDWKNYLDDNEFKILIAKYNKQ